MTSTTYERLDHHEVDQVRSYRRSLWTERALRDPQGARAQVVDALAKHSDPWVDGVHLTTLADVAFTGTTVGDLTTDQRYALIALLRGATS